jgi:hypothetical protein
VKLASLLNVEQKRVYYNEILKIMLIELEGKLHTGSA